MRRKLQFLYLIIDCFYTILLLHTYNTVVLFLCNSAYPNIITIKGLPYSWSLHINMRRLIINYFYVMLLLRTYNTVFLFLYDSHIQTSYLRTTINGDIGVCIQIR